MPSTATTSAGCASSFPARELLYKHPNGVYFGPNVEWVPQAYYVDSANTLKTEPVRDLGRQGRVRQRRSAWARPTSRPAISPMTHYIASTSITDNANPAIMPLFEPGTGRAVYAGVKYKW